MFQQTFAIIRNTFLESIRQPVMLVILLAASLAIPISNPLSGFTMSNDQRMLIDLGLATVFLCGMLMAAFIATNVLGREIENRTALTVISKPLSRPLFVIGKYLGVAGAMALGTVYMAFVFMLTEQHRVLQTVRDPYHMPVLAFSAAALFIGLAVAVWCNFFYGKVFSSTFICITTPLAGLAYLFSMMYRHDFTPQPISQGFHPQLWLALAALLIAILMLTAIAIAASTRLSQVMTLLVTIAFFLTGMLSDWFFGRPLSQFQQDWTHRVQALSDRELAPHLEQINPDALRRWVNELFLEKARRQHTVDLCKAQMEVFKYPERLKLVSAADRKAQIEALDQKLRREAAEAYQRYQAQADQMTRLVHMPITRDQVMYELDWPQTIQRKNGECETITSKKTFVYPPLRDALIDGRERLANAAYRAAYSIVPNFQVLLLSDAITQDHLIPVSYIATAALYGLTLIIAALALATILFQRREVG
jgi:ABC-2 type transport system permease protein